MKKNDKLVVIFGVVILIIASIGIYTWTPEVTSKTISEIEQFFDVTSSLSNLPEAIAVSVHQNQTHLFCYSCQSLPFIVQVKGRMLQAWYQEVPFPHLHSASLFPVRV